MNRSRNILGAICAGVMIVVSVVLLLSLCGCNHKPKLPCPESELQIVKVDKPIPCIVEIAPLEPAPKPTPLPFPEDVLDEEVKKAWALKVGEAVESQHALQLARDAAWLVKITEHNKALPKCSEIPTPVP